MDIKKLFASNIKTFRIKNNLSQESLAYKAGLDRTYIHSIEKGQRNVSISVVEKLAKALNVDIKDLFNE